MIGWVIARTGPAKERQLAKDCIEISIPAYIPERLFYRPVSRHSPVRVPRFELIAPRLVFLQSGFAKIRQIEALAEVPVWESLIGDTYHIGQVLPGGVVVAKRLRNFEGFVLDDHQDPYVISHAHMLKFQRAIDHMNGVVSGAYDETQKSGWSGSVGWKDVVDRMKKLVGM